MITNIDFKIKYKAIGIILALVMLMQIPLGVFAASYTWNDINTKTGVYVTSDGVSMLWSPEDGYVSRQNPPDFTWPYVNNATSYDFRICTRPYANDSKVYEKSAYCQYIPYLLTIQFQRQR